MDIEEAKWEEQIKKRNKLIKDGYGEYNFYVVKPLKEKLLSAFEEPAKEEIHIWYLNNY